MEHFRVIYKDHVHVIGLPETGVLHVTVGAVERRDGSRYCDLHLGGLDNITDEHVNWPRHDLKPGDQILIEVLEGGEFDEPTTRHRDDTEEDLEESRDYVRREAARLGWTLIENPEPDSSTD